MNDKEKDNSHSVTENGVQYELTGYRIEDGDWHDIEKGANYPTDKQMGEIDLVTVNLAPDSDDGFYRSFSIFMGFDELYTIDDLVDEAADAYGFGVS